MPTVPNRFPRNEIASLTDEHAHFDLAESVGPDLVLADLLDIDAVEAFQALPLCYSAAQGDAPLRTLIAARHDIDADKVVVLPGGMQALFLSAFILCGPGTRTIIGTPVFPNARTAAASTGSEVIDLPIRYDNRYQLNLNLLADLLTPETKLVSLASPQNPSGVALPEDDIRHVLNLMSERSPNAFLLLDETYREATYGDDPVRPSTVNLDARIITCGSLSKCHGAPGLRTGWAASQDGALIQQLINGKFNTTICSSIADDFLANQVLKRQDHILATRRKHLSACLAKLEEFVTAHSGKLDWVRPDAGALCCLRLKPEAIPETTIPTFHAKLKTLDVRVGDGEWFGESPNVFRLGFGLLSQADFEEALRRMGSVLETL